MAPVELKLQMSLINFVLDIENSNENLIRKLEDNYC